MCCHIPIENGNKKRITEIQSPNFIISKFLNWKKNGAARLDHWEIFLLLALKIPFHFISLRKLENYLQFYMTIAFKLNRTKKKVHHKFEIAFHFKKEIPLKCFLSPWGDTLSPLGIDHFTYEIPFKFILNKKKIHQNIEPTFNLK